MHFLCFTPDLVAVLFAVAGIALFLPALQRPILSWLDDHQAAIDFWQPGRRGLARRMLLTALAVAPFVLFRAATHLLGDGYLILHELTVGVATNMSRLGHEPASLTLVTLLYRLGVPLGWSAETAYRVVSVVCGLMYVLLSFAVAGALGRALRQRLLALGLLLTGGHVQLFFGYVETYALALITALLYLWLGLLAAQRRVPLWLAAAAAGVAVTFHFSLVTLLPSLLVLVWLRASDHAHDVVSKPGPPGKSEPAEAHLVRRRPLAGDLACLLLVPALAASLLLVMGFHPRSYLAALRPDHMLPLFGQPDFYQPYRLFSMSHLRDALNQLLLCAPVAVLALPVALRRSARATDSHQVDGQSLFLSSAALFPLLFAWLVNPEIGAFRDWDLLALPAVPLALWVARLLPDRIPDRRDLSRVALVVCGAIALHSALWIGVNAGAGRAVARFQAALESTALSRHAHGYGWESLGYYFDRIQHDSAAALQAYERAIAADPDNPRYWGLAGGQQAARGHTDQAIRCLQAAVQKQVTDDPRYLNNLASLYVATGRLAEAIDCLRQAVSRKPDFAMGHHSLGVVLARTGRLEEAVQSFRRAVELNPTDVTMLNDLGTALMQLGRRDEAEAIFERIRNRGR